MAILMPENHSHTLWQAFVTFYRYAPWRLTLSLGLMLFQGITSGIGLLLIIPLLQLVGIGFSGQTDPGLAGIINRFFADSGLPLTLPSVLIAYVVIVALISGSRYWLSVLSVTLQQGYICNLRQNLYDALLHAHWQFIVNHRMSDFIHSLSGQVQSIGHAVNLLLNMISQIILTLIFISLALMLSWKMSLLALACALGLVTILLPLNRVILHSGKKQLIGFKAIFRMLTEQLASLKMIKSYASEKHYTDQLAEASHTLEQQNIRLTKVNALTQLVYMTGAATAFALLFYFSLKWLSVSLPTLILLLLLFSRLLPQVSGIQSNWQKLLHQLPAFADVEHMLSACNNAREPQQDRQPSPEFNHKISINNVSYHYPGNNRPVIDNLSVDIIHNHTTAITGPSGIGKSTLADLLAGLLKPDTGTIFCDETALSDNNRIPWRNKIAYVTQEVFLFHDTVRANLDWVSKDINDDAIWNALHLAAADDFVRALPEGLNTMIGDRGIRLSGGERQRLALARALLSKPALLILDEATSALDHENEQKIQPALKQLQGKLTIIIIAHRDTTIQHADATINLGTNAASVS